MRFMSMWSIIITSVIIRARAMSCSFHYLAQQAWMTAQCSVVNGLADCSNTTSARPHEFFCPHRGGPHGAAVRLGMKHSILQFHLRKLGLVRPGT